MRKFTGLSPLFKAVKAGVKRVTGLENIDWYNAQFDGTQLYEQGAFVEFPEEITFNRIDKKSDRASIRLRIHVYTKYLGEVDGYVPQQASEDHDALALAVRDALDWKALFEKQGDFYVADFHDPDFQTNPEGQLTKVLRFAAWRHWHRYQGHLITWVDFTTTIEA